MDLCLVKLNGWPDSFDERIFTLAENLHSLTIIRPKPSNYDSSLDDIDSISVYELRPSRPESIDAIWIHPLLFLLYVIQAVTVVSYLIINPRTNIDIIHSVDYVVNGLAAAILSIIWDVPTVISVRGLTEFRYKNHVDNNPSKLGRFNLRIVQVIPSIVFKQADHIITKSEYQVDFILENYETLAEFSVIPTGVDFSTFDPNKYQIQDDDIAESLGFPSCAFCGPTILHLGKLTKNKGIHNLLSFIQESNDYLDPEIRFICVGRTRNEDFKEEILRVEDQIERILVHPNQIPFQLVPQLLKKVDGLILLSEAGHEGTPRVLQESYTMGTPIIASDVTGIKGAFSDLEGAILIDRNDVQEFRDAVRSIAEKDIEVKRTDARENFDIETNYAKYADIYQSAILKRSDRTKSVN